MEKIKSLTFWPNGHVSAYNELDEQMDLIHQKGWLELYFDFLLEMGYDVREAGILRAKNNYGEFVKVTPSMTAEGKWYYGFEVDV